MPEIDVAGALEALEAKGGMPDVIPSTGQDPFNRNAMGQFARPAPEPASAPAAPVEGGNVPEAPAATPETGTATEGEPESFTHIDPSTLPPDLQQLYRGMQGDYTRKTQEVASWRKVAEEAGVESPEQIREALTVYQRLSDPQNWGTIHAELGQYMQQLGMSPQAASAAATEAIAEFAPADEVGPDFSEYGEELAPLLKAFQVQQQEIQSLKQLVTTDAQRRQQQAQFEQVAAHIERQETALKAARPDLSEGELEVVYSLMGDDMDMSKAVARYDSVVAQRLQAVYNAKVAQGGSVPASIGNAGVITAEAPEARPEGVEPADYGHQQAMKALAAMEAAERLS